MARLCPPAKLNAAMHLLEDDPEAAVERLQELARKYGKDPAVRYGLGVALLDNDETPSALEHLEFAEQRGFRDDVVDDLLEAYGRLGMVGHAERLAKRADRSEDDDEASERGFLLNHGPDWRELPRKDLLALERARLDALNRAPGVLVDLERLAKRHPGWIAIHTSRAGIAFAMGEVATSFEAADAALAAGPDDAAALLHATRAAFLKGGSKAARSLLPRFAAANSHRGPVFAAGAWADASALADDAEALRAALEALERARESEGIEDGDGDDRADLHQALARREAHPAAPLTPLSEVVAPILGAWTSLNEEQLDTRVSATMARTPGLLSEIPKRIGFEPPRFATVVARLLLTGLVPDGPAGPWSEVLSVVARQGPGTNETRIALLTILAGLGLADEDTTIHLEGFDGDVTLHGFQVSGEAVANDLVPAEQERLTRALHQLTHGRAGKARTELEALLNAHPNDASLAHNLALAERLTGDRDRGNARLERVVVEHPEHMFARTMLAFDAIEAGDLGRARDLLQAPTGRKRLHVREWCAYAAATGHLELALGDVDAAERYLESIGAIVGIEDVSYRRLEQAIDDQAWSTLEPDDEGDNDEVEEEDDPDPARLATLPSLGDAWQLAGAPVAIPIGRPGEMRPLTMVAVTDREGYLRSMHFREGRFDGRAAFSELARACLAEHDAASPELPQTVTIDDPELVRPLQVAAAGTGITVRLGDADAAREAIEGAAQDLGSGVPTHLARFGAEEAHRFLEAFQAFEDAEAWSAFTPDSPIAVRLGQGPWRFATATGHDSAELGIALFDGIAELHAFLDGDDTSVASQAVVAAGTFEHVGIVPLSLLSPLDAHWHLVHSGETDPGAYVPAALRFGPDGPTEPLWPLPAYTALLEALVAHTTSTTPPPTRLDATLETSVGSLRVAYPVDDGSSVGVA